MSTLEKRIIGFEEPSWETQEQPKFGKVYVGTKIVRAEPMTHGDFLMSQNKLGGQETLGDGYRVQYEDGYISWSPKEVFERCYRELSVQEIEMTK